MLLTFGPVAFSTSDDWVPRDSAIAHFLVSGPEQDPWPSHWYYELEFAGQLVATKPMTDFPSTTLQPKACPGMASFEVTHPTLGFNLKVAQGVVRLTLLRPMDMTEFMPALKTALCFVTICTLAAEHAGIVVHSSATEASGRAHLLSGPHGQGKSTTADYLGKQRKLADDISFILEDGQGGLVCGGLTRAETRVLPLGSINFLRRGERSAVGPVLSVAQAYKSLFQRTVMWPELLPDVQAIEAFILRVASAVPCRELAVNLADISRDLLFPQERGLS
jgi:hypothetical protein